MPKDEELQKHTLNLRRGDWDALGAYYRDIPVSTVVRQLISRYVDQIEATGTAPTANVEVQL